ncbi:MAG: hypothetical protein HY301_04665 [Verrucomicrobia bacterium]|nr:hypothetical protein [Verrucomicrobiota bacterium]
MKSLPAGERARVVEETIRELTAAERKSIERFLRRLQHPDVPEAFWEGVEDHEDERTVEMETALHDRPPGRK